MYKNFIRVALGNMRRNKINSLIIIFGLGTGIACAVLSFLFIHNELSFDRFQNNYNTIYEVKLVLDLPVGRAVSVPKAHTALDLARDYPEVVRAVRMEKLTSVVRYEEKIFEEKALAAEGSFLNMFSFPLKYGETEKAMSRKDGVVLSEAVSRKYFGDRNPVGSVLSVKVAEDFSDFVITGVLKKIPDTSSLQFAVLFNLEKLYGEKLNDPRGKLSTTCFIQLQNKNQAEGLREKFKTTIDVPVQERYTEGSGHFLQPLAGFHLRGEYGSHVLTQKSTVNYSLILGAIALLVLVIACFNYINLTIGMSSTRIKEIGVRKVLGAQRRILIKQFCTESLLFSFLSLVLGLVMVELFLPGFNRLAQKTLGLGVFFRGWITVSAAGFVFLLGIAAGFYPALFLSRFSSVDLFRGKMNLSRKNMISRFLIVFQFAVSIFLILTTIFLYRQKNYMLNSDLGYEADRVMVVPMKGMMPDSTESAAFVSTLKNKLLGYEMIQGASAAAYNLTEGWMGTYFKSSGGKNKLVVYNYVDWDYIPTLGIEVTTGRNFSRDFPSDAEGAVIINKSFARMLKMESPEGHRLSEFFEVDFDRRIIGVVADFHSRSLHNPIHPAFMGISGTPYDFLYVKVKGERLGEAAASVKKEFAALAPQIPFEYSFLDDEVNRQYRREAHWTRMVEYASLFAILIACSGLLGLTLQIVYQRTREIGIRRVLGASARDILTLINKEFIWLVVGANVFAWPAGYFAVSTLLKDYAFRVSLAPWVFVVSGILALLMAAVTISFHAIKAAHINPAKTLKYE